MHQHLDRSELSAHLRHRSTHRAFVGHVRLDHHQARTRLAEVCPEALDLSFVNARRRDAMTVLEKPPRHRAPQGAGPAGHQRYTTHSSTPVEKDATSPPDGVEEQPLAVVDITRVEVFDFR